MQSLPDSYDAALVLLSILISVFASYTALDLGGRIRASAGVARAAWLLAAAVAMGAGIWSMHFVGMLAFSIPVPTRYDIELTALSLLTAVAATGIGFAVVGRRETSLSGVAGGAVLMGVGIVSMHYIGMAAMQMPAHIHYDPLLVGLSVAIAVVASGAALWLALETEGMLRKALAAAAMGAAVCGMHYTGMRAATFHGFAAAGRESALDLPSSMLATAIAAITFFILFLALLAAIFDRRMALQAERDAVALRQSERRFRAYFDHLPERLFVLDVCPDGALRFEMLNPTVERQGGISSDEARGKTPVELLGSEAGGRLEASYRRCIAAGGPLQLEQELEQPNGRRTLDVTLVPLRDESGRIVKIMGSARDITERKAAEETVRQMQKMEAVGQLTGGVAHDFNNLLTAVIGNLELLAHRPAGETERKLVESAMRAALRGAKLTQQLLAFSRRQQLQPRPIDVNELVSGMGDLLARTIGSTIEIRTALQDGLWPAVADPNQLELVVLNLAINARDAMSLDGSLTIETANVGPGHAKRPRDLADGDRVLIAVRDTGTGMSPETLAKAFEPFFTTKEVGKGSGLGLSQVYGIARQSGGSVEIDSRLGEGTEVRVYLPRARNAAVTLLSAARQGGDEMAGSGTILVVDDDPDARELTVRALREIGYRICEADGAARALQLLDDGRAFDLLVLDYAMPGMNGAQLAAAARARRPELPLLFTTGHADAATLDAWSCADTLRKPFTLSELARQVRDLLPSDGAAPGSRQRSRP
jgi:PAS domain S-box-containing protein